MIIIILYIYIYILYLYCRSTSKHGTDNSLQEVLEFRESGSNMKDNANL